MKILLGSDYHIGFQEELKIPNEPADIFVIAGDLAHSFSVIEKALIAAAEKFPYVIYVPGNHEHYRSLHSFALNFKTLLRSIPKNVFTTDKYSKCEINGQQFLFGTGWTYIEKEEYECMRCLADFYYLEVSDYNARHTDCVNYFKNNLTKDSIVITHHLPSRKSIANMYKDSKINEGFFSEKFEKLLIDFKPKLWLHGHTHFPFDYRIGDTRIVCNPKGYTGEFDRNFKEVLIEI